MGVSVVDVDVVAEVEVKADEALEMTVPGPRSRTMVEFLQHELSDPQQK